MSDVTRAVLAEVHAERIAQDQRWGQQDHPDYMESTLPWAYQEYAQMAAQWKFTNALRVNRMEREGAPPGQTCAWDGILLEEVFEALGEEDPVLARQEWIQVAAVAVARIEAADRREVANGVNSI